eukprot:1160322-Pelagomonas_calceolata.AAC.4
MEPWYTLLSTPTLVPESDKDNYDGGPDSSEGNEADEEEGVPRSRGRSNNGSTGLRVPRIGRRRGLLEAQIRGELLPRASRSYVAAPCAPYVQPHVLLLLIYSCAATSAPPSAAMPHPHVLLMCSFAHVQPHVLISSCATTRAPPSTAMPQHHVLLMCSFAHVQPRVPVDSCAATSAPPSAAMPQPHVLFPPFPPPPAPIPYLLSPEGSSSPEGNRLPHCVSRRSQLFLCWRLKAALSLPALQGSSFSAGVSRQLSPYLHFKAALSLLASQGSSLYLHFKAALSRLVSQGSSLYLHFKAVLSLLASHPYHTPTSSVDLGTPRHASLQDRETSSNDPLAGATPQADQDLQQPSMSQEEIREVLLLHQCPAPKRLLQGIQYMVSDKVASQEAVMCTESGVLGGAAALVPSTQAPSAGYSVCGGKVASQEAVMCT